jgi:hypothetical protein
MYTIEDGLMHQAQAVLTALATELRAQEASGEMAPVHIRSLIREASAGGVAEGDEVAYLASIADRLEGLFPIADLFPSKRLKWAQKARDEGTKGR